MNPHQESSPEEAKDRSSSAFTKTMFLIHKANAGDQEAMNDLLMRYELRLRGFIHSKLRGPLRARMETMDIAQEVFHIAFKRLNDFDPRSPAAFYHWLLKIANMKLKDAFKYHVVAGVRDVRKEIPIHGKPDESKNLAEILRAPSTHWETKQEKMKAFNHLKEKIDRLSEEYQQVIMLKFFEDLSPIEMSERLGISPDACRMRLLRALKKLNMQYKQGSDNHAR